MILSKAFRWTMAAGLTLLAAFPAARAADNEAQSYAHPWQLWHPEPVTTTMEWIDGLHYWLLIVAIAICFFVFALLAYAMIRFRESRNPTPSRTAHNTLVEVLWTV